MAMHPALVDLDAAFSGVSVPFERQRNQTRGRGPANRYSPGQSLGEVAKAYHASTRAIISANRLHPPYDLKAGARLIIPVAETVASVKGDKPHRSRGLAQSASAAKPSEPPEVIPLD